MCTLGNGSFATRGAAPEAVAGEAHYPGTYAAGLYDRLQSQVAGRVVENEDLVNLPNWLPLSFRIEDGEWFDAGRADLLAYRQELDLRSGTLLRLIRFADPEGRITEVTQRRLVHMGDPHLAALQTTFLAENWSGRLEVRSGLDGRVTNAGVARYAELRGDHLAEVDTAQLDEETTYLTARTRASGIDVALAARTRVFRGGEHVPVNRRPVEEPGSVAQDLGLTLERGEAMTVEKVVTLFTSRDRAISEPGTEARAWIARAGGFDELLERHAHAWATLWRRFDIRIEGSERAQMLLRLHVFHLCQTVSEHSMELDAGVPARGLHGEAYRGHIFWDELFILPVLTHRHPQLTRALIEYRRRRLPEARWAAHQIGHRGAMFPWQSGSSGREETQVLHLNPRSGRWLPDHSRNQRHINIAIAYNAWQYYEVTGDLVFLRYGAAEMLVEIARFWASIATYDAASDRYEIVGVMGPDEYHDAYSGSEEPGLRNNAYTNIMAVWVLLRALEAFERLPEYHRQELWERVGLTRREVDRWEEVTRKMAVPFHDDGIISQFEGYGDLEELDWEKYREKYGNIHRLDRILEAEGDTTNRYKVSKQADVLMLFFLLSPEEIGEILERLGYRFDPEHDLRRMAEYYEQRTSHGSTLSRLVHSWVLSHVDRDRSWALFLEALESDVSDVQGGTTSEGIHLGAMAGTVDLVQRGYTRLEMRDHELRMDPVLPAGLEGMEFDLHSRGHRLTVRIDDGQLRVSSRPGSAPPIRLRLCERRMKLAAGEQAEVPLQPVDPPRSGPSAL